MVRLGRVEIELQFGADQTSSRKPLMEEVHNNCGIQPSDTQSNLQPYTGFNNLLPHKHGVVYLITVEDRCFSQEDSDFTIRITAPIIGSQRHSAESLRGKAIRNTVNERGVLKRPHSNNYPWEWGDCSNNTEGIEPGDWVFVCGICIWPSGTLTSTIPRKTSTCRKGRHGNKKKERDIFMSSKMQKWKLLWWEYVDMWKHKVVIERAAGV